MDREIYKAARQKAIEDYKKELERWQKAQVDLVDSEQRIMGLKEIIVSLSKFCGDAVKLEPPKLPVLADPNNILAGVKWQESPLGLTDAVRQILSAYRTEGLFPDDIRDRLLRSGFDDTKQQNILASIHTTLRRLQESGEAELVEIEGKTAYQYKKKPIDYHGTRRKYNPRRLKDPEKKD